MIEIISQPSQWCWNNGIIATICHYLSKKQKFTQFSEVRWASLWCIASTCSGVMTNSPRLSPKTTVDHISSSAFSREISNLIKRISTNLELHVQKSEADPPEKCHLTVKKLTKTWHFFKKIDKNCHFFKKIAIGNFVEKNDNFWQFFFKNVKFLSIFWHSNGNFPEVQVPIWSK